MSEGMAFRISFRSGIRQSFQATKYFRSVADALTGALIPSMSPRQFVVGFPTGEMLPLRVWSITDRIDEHLDALLDRLSAVHRDIRALHQGGAHARDLQRMMRNWLDIHCEGETFFLEQFPPSRSSSFDPEGSPDLSIGVLGGHTVMVSSKTVMYVQLEDDVFGLSLARHGSYLLEKLPDSKDGLPPHRD